MSMCSIFHRLLHSAGNVSEYFSLNPTEKQTVTVSVHVGLLKMNYNILLHEETDDVMLFFSLD